MARPSISARASRDFANLGILKQCTTNPKLSTNKPGMRPDARLLYYPIGEAFSNGFPICFLFLRAAFPIRRNLKGSNGAVIN